MQEQTDQALAAQEDAQRVAAAAQQRRGNSGGASVKQGPSQAEEQPAGSQLAAAKHAGYPTVSLVPAQPRLNPSAHTMLGRSMAATPCLTAQARRCAGRTSCRQSAAGGRRTGRPPPAGQAGAVEGPRPAGDSGRGEGFVGWQTKTMMTAVARLSRQLFAGGHACAAAAAPASRTFSWSNVGSAAIACEYVCTSLMPRPCQWGAGTAGQCLRAGCSAGFLPERQAWSCTHGSAAPSSQREGSRCC